ncbi:ARM repeat-containing protein, partial [Neoconidiobolus thromboides FSU 785]
MSSIYNLNQELNNLSISATSSISEFQKALSTAKSSDEINKAADSIASFIKDNGVATIGASDLLYNLDINAVSKASPEVREGSLRTYNYILNTISKPCEPFIVSVLPNILECLSDKSSNVRQAADEVINSLLKIISPNSVKPILPVLFSALELNKKWQTKEGALNIIASLPTIAHRQVQDNLKDILPVVSDAMWDSK